MPIKFYLLAVLILAITGIALGLDRTAEGTLIVLAITLATIIKYASDTNRIANATEQKWEQEMKPKLLYEIVVDSEKRADKFAFRLMNPTDYMIDAKVNCNFRIYGEPVKYDPAYDGTHTWGLFPHQMSQGTIPLSGVLGKKGKNPQQMTEERNASNASKQLTMDLELDFENEVGRNARIPSRRHHFDFKRWIWIPKLTRLNS